MPVDDTTPDGIRQTWEDRIRQARTARRRFEPRFLSDLAFAAGQTWQVWDKRRRQMRHISQVDPRYADRELYTINKIREYREAQLGELASDDDRPQLLVAQDGEDAEDAAKQLNQAVAYAWEHEWDADTALQKARAYCVDLGVSAIRCCWDPDAGEITSHHPLGPDGKPIPAGSPLLDQLREQGTIDGRLPAFKPVRQGRTRWQAYSALQLLPPPGVNHEDDFPWEILYDVALVDDLKDEYGAKAASLVEDTDIASVMGITSPQTAAAGEIAEQRLRGYCWRYVCFQRPTRRWPDGRFAVLASNRFVLLDNTDELDYQLPGGRPHTGVVYLHWWRATDRFWSQSLIGALKDPQRIIDRRETQNLEIIDRGMPAAYVEDGTLEAEPTGAPMEHRRLKKDAAPPIIFAGIGPGEWMYRDLDHHAENLSHASTLSPLRLGENPQNVDTYSQLQLLNDNEGLKRDHIKIEHRARVGTLTELGVQDIERYWPDEKKILVSGDDDQVSYAIFRKARIPAFYRAKVAKGAPQLRSQGAELKKVDAVWQAAVESGVAAKDPEAWTDWYSRSISAGSMQELPEPPRDSQQEMARLENLLMRDGQPMPVMDYDLLPVHLPEHREAMDEARAAGDLQWLARLDAHVKSHVAQAQANAAEIAATAPPPPPPAAPAAAQPSPSPSLAEGA